MKFDKYIKGFYGVGVTCCLIALMLMFVSCSERCSDKLGSGWSRPFGG